MVKVSIDPITLEILLHRLWQITDEMAITLRRVSGSVITVAARDYIAALLDPKGVPVMVGTGAATHGGVVSLGVKHILQAYAENPGINEGDVFFANDNQICSLHRPDAFVISPIHHKGKLVGWCVSMTHLADIGSIDPGGFCPSARDSYQEGFRFTGVKIVEQGRIRKDIWESVLSMSREPDLVGLDIKAQIAASAVARRRMGELIEQYGVDIYNALCDEAMKYSEVRLRSRLRELPDGTWRAVQYCETDGLTDRVYEIVVAMTKEGDSLTFDFTGTSKQAPTFINCTALGVRGAIFAALGTLLCWDIPWNDGIMNPVKIILPDRTIISAKDPAPSSLGTIGGTWVATNATVLCLSKMLGCSEKYKGDLITVTQAVAPSVSIAGINQYGTYFTVTLMDGVNAGGAARSYADGADSSGSVHMPGAVLPNAEEYELNFPILYLSRRHTTDSGGPGMFRGGVSETPTIMLHRAPEGKIGMFIWGSIDEAAGDLGLCGGYPGNNTRRTLLRNSDINERIRQGELPTTIDELQGTLEVLPPCSVIEWGAADVLEEWMLGGGGYGDPIDRDPEAVSRDVVDGLVSLECVKNIYGVIIDPKTFKTNFKETEKRREEIKKNRRELK